MINSTAKVPTSDQYWHPNCKSKVYVDQFRRWFAAFRREQFFVATLEQFKVSPVDLYSRVCTFLGVEAVGDSNAFLTMETLRAQLDRRYNEVLPGVDFATEFPVFVFLLLNTYFAQSNRPQTRGRTKTRSQSTTRPGCYYSGFMLLIPPNCPSCFRVVSTSGRMHDDIGLCMGLVRCCRKARALSCAL